MKPGESLATEAGQKSRVVLPDGSVLYLNQNTSVELAAARHVTLKRGEVFVEAVPAKSDADRFRVDTPQRAVTALGTKFAVSATKSETGVHVTQGKVEVSGLDQPLTSGQELAPGTDKITPAPRASAALDWARDLMVAAESPLVPAGKYSGGSLVAVDPYGQEAKLRLVKYHIDVHVEDGFARTTIDQTYFNNENQRMEGTFYFPLPPDASLSRLAMYVEGNLMEGGMAEQKQRPTPTRPSATRTATRPSSNGWTGASSRCASSARSPAGEADRPELHAETAGSVRPIDVPVPGRAHSGDGR